MSETAQQAKRIVLFPLEKAKPTTPDYNGNIEWNTDSPDKLIGDVIVYKGTRQGRRILKGVIIYTEAVAQAIGRKDQKFEIDVLYQQSDDDVKPAVKGLMLMEGETVTMNVSLWKRGNDKIKTFGYYYSGVIGESEPEQLKDGI